MQKIYVISFVLLICMEFLQASDQKGFCARESPKWAKSKSGEAVPGFVATIVSENAKIKPSGVVAGDVTAALDKLCIKDKK